MTQKSPSKHLLLHPIENHRNIYQFNHDIGTNTPDYDEQIARTIDNGNATEEIVQDFMEAEISETYWKLMTEQRRQAIIETNIENEQLHSLIDDLSKENDKLRIISNHCNHLQNVLKTLTTKNDSLLNDSRID